MHCTWIGWLHLAQDSVNWGVLEETFAPRWTWSGSWLWWRTVRGGSKQAVLGRSPHTIWHHCVLLESTLLASSPCFKKLKRLPCYISWPKLLVMQSGECARIDLTESSNQNVSSESWRHNAESMLKLFIPCSFPLLLFCFCHNGHNWTELLPTVPAES